MGGLRSGHAIGPANYLLATRHGTTCVAGHLDWANPNQPKRALILGPRNTRPVYSAKLPVDCQVRRSLRPYRLVTRVGGTMFWL